MEQDWRVMRTTRRAEKMNVLRSTLRNSGMDQSRSRCGAQNRTAVGNVPYRPCRPCSERGISVRAPSHSRRLPGEVPGVLQKGDTDRRSKYDEKFDETRSSTPVQDIESDAISQAQGH